MSMLSEFRVFALKGNVIDLAVGVIIGGAFGKIVDSLVRDLVMPVVGAIFGGLDFSNYFIALTTKIPPDVPRTYEALTKAGVPLVRLRQFPHRPAQLPDPGVHHLPDGPTVQPCPADGDPRKTDRSAVAAAPVA